MKARDLEVGVSYVIKAGVNPKEIIEITSQHHGHSYFSWKRESFTDTVEHTPNYSDFDKEYKIIEKLGVKEEPDNTTITPTLKAKDLKAGARYILESHTSDHRRYNIYSARIEEITKTSILLIFTDDKEENKNWERLFITDFDEYYRIFEEINSES